MKSGLMRGMAFGEKDLIRRRLLYLANLFFGKGVLVVSWS
jgi:hypothetical protein